MKLLVKGKNVDISERLQAYAEKRLGKLSQQLDDDVTRLELEITEEKNPKISDSHVAEATIWTKGPTIRARESSHDVYASIDLVAEKVERQVRKYREKRIQYQHGGPHRNGNGRYKSALQAEGTPDGGIADRQMADADTPNLETFMDSPHVNIVKTKQFNLGPMSPEEAALQMDLVGHDFFVFVNDENNQTSVLYKRNDGNYGLIEPTLTASE